MRAKKNREGDPSVSAIHSLHIVCAYTQGDQKVSVHLMITIQSSGAQRIFDHSINK